LSVRLRPVPLVLAVTCFAVGLTSAVPASAAAAQEELVETGEQLYLTGCSSCHGAEGGGVTVDGERRGPSLEDAGEASAFYYLSTGRMPLGNPDDQPQRKDPAYSPEEIDALVAFVASLGDGPALPDVEIDGADLAEGGVIYRANCQACHSAFGSGGALSYGRAAPNLHAVDPAEVAAAVRVGPGQMPVFGEESVGADQLDDLVAYVDYLRNPENAGGLQIGRNGPVPEGFVAWLFGIGGALLIVAWIGGRDPRRTSGGHFDEGRGPGAQP
jgi:ubiquinol-cytochrome c reductase cytochrome c subunit